MNESRENKKEVEQLDPSTGLSHDYMNEIVGFKTFLSTKGMEKVRNIIKTVSFKMKKYEEHFPPLIYNNAITDKNRDSVKRLDELADQMNEKIKDLDTFSEEDFLKIFDEIELLVRGNKGNKGNEELNPKSKT